MHMIDLLIIGSWHEKNERNIVHRHEAAIAPYSIAKENPHAKFNQTNKEVHKTPSVLISVKDWIKM
jgi:hypothetical protein